MQPARAHNLSLNTFSTTVIILLGGAMLVACLWQSSCTASVEQENPFLGKWSLISAARNGKLTRTLEDGYLHFLNDTIFATNIFSEDEEFKYLLTKTGFKQLGSEKIDFELLNTANDTLILGADIRDYEFLFVAIRDTLYEEETFTK